MRSSKKLASVLLGMDKFGNFLGLFCFLLTWLAAPILQQMEGMNAERIRLRLVFLSIILILRLCTLHPRIWCLPAGKKIWGIVWGLTCMLQFGYLAFLVFATGLESVGWIMPFIFLIYNIPGVVLLLIAAGESDS